MRKLARFTVAEAAGGFTLHIADDAGQAIEVAATRDQLDVIADELDEMLSRDESADEIGEDEDVGSEDDDAFEADDKTS